MRISTKGRYALRIMLDLAMNDTGEHVNIRTIAARQEISMKYSEQIISILSHAGFVISARGTQGGYRLSRLPKDYTVGMILRLTEGSLSPVPCTQETKFCTRQDKCATQEVWRRLEQAINGVVDHMTLADLVEIQHSLNDSDFVI